MADGTKIEWADATWSPASGCTRISDGCLNCYIPRTPVLRMVGRKFDTDRIGATTGVQLHPTRLAVPLHWRKPRRIFVCSVADLFHTEVPADYIAAVFAHMIAAPQHTYLVLSKRHSRMRHLLTSSDFWAAVSVELGRLRNTEPPTPLTAVPDHIWIGVSVESQKWADARIPALLDIPAHTRWLSCEPLIGPVDLSMWLTPKPYWGPTYRELVWAADRQGEVSDLVVKSGISWAVVGGESGPGARPMKLGWARDIVQQCRDHGVAPYVKQLGKVWAQDTHINGQPVHRTDPKGGNPDHWPIDLRVREYPATPATVGGAA